MSRHDWKPESCARCSTRLAPTKAGDKWPRSFILTRYADGGLWRYLLCAKCNDAFAVWLDATCNGTSRPGKGRA